MSEQEIEAEAARLSALSQKRVQELREAHGMSHKFTTGPECYDNNEQSKKGDKPRW